MRKRLVLGLLLGVAAVAVAVAFVPGSGAQSNFGTVSLRSGFTPDPHVASGNSGGSIDASGRGSSCRGYITAQPDHILVLESRFSFLRVFAQSSGDTTLVIQGNGQTWCNDDTYGSNPSVEGSFAPGRYSVWVGSYAAGQNHAYQLKFTELTSVTPSGGGGGTTTPPSNTGSTQVCGTSLTGRHSCINANAPRPNFGCRGGQGCQLRTGFTPDPWPFQLTAGGGSDPLNVETLGLSDANGGGACGRSYVTAAPDFRFYFEAGTSFNLLRFYVVTRNGADATLLINSPNAQWYCNDDSHSTLMPTVDFRNPTPGRYDIWVGTYDGSSRNPATFYVTELESNHP